MYRLELTEEQHRFLLYSLGIATAAALLRSEDELGHRIFELTQVIVKATDFSYDQAK